MDTLPPPQRPRWVFILRLFLFFVLVFMLWTIGRFFWTEDKDNFLTLFDSPAELLLSHVVNLEITGQDSQNRLYILTSTSAKPKDNVLGGFFSQAGMLKNVEITIEWRKDQWFSVRSALGEFNHKDKRLVAGPNFNVYFSNGYQIKGSKAFLDLKTNNMIVEGQVEGWGPVGEISAAAMDVEEGGQYVRFYGGVEVLLFNQGGR